MSTVGVEVTNSSYIDFNKIPVTLAYRLEFFKDDHQASRNNQSRAQHPTAQRSFYAGFAQAEFSFSPAFTLSSGLRYDAFSLDPPDNFSRRNESALSPWLALNWQPSDHWQFFTSVSQAFRAPTLTEIYAEGTHFRRPLLDKMGRPISAKDRVQVGINPVTRQPIFINVERPILLDNTFEPNPDLKSEKATQMEIGTRYQRSNVAAAGDQLLLSANAYYSIVDDYIETFFPAFDDRNPDQFISNSEGTSTRNIDAVLYGLEAEMSYDAEYWFASANLTIPRGNEKGNSEQLVSIPQDRASITVGLKPNSQWEVGVRSTVASERDVNDEDGNDTDGFVTFDLFANLQLGDDPSSGALVSFGIDNVTNQTYKLHPNGLNSPGRSVKLNTQFTF